MNKAVWLLVALSIASGAAHAQSGLEEILVTGTKVEDTHIPATSLKRQADFLLLQVEISNDSRDYKIRRDEIYATLRAVLAAAERDHAIELSVIREDNIVLPLKLEDTTLNFQNNGVGGTLETTISIKTPIGSGASDGATPIAKLKNFVSSIKPAGRTTLDEGEETQVSVVNIAQYRDPVIQLFANDVRKVTTALGGDYRVVIRGLDQPIQWIRSGTLDVTIFVPYKYDIVPTSISSYSPEYRTSED
ncbi:hypothetical protein [Steroidobacter agaridevorans]|uniref:hypothetical protein n=1 Tax=Steroidobacter agaridevorans TaxID=2695856 RepID=UPI001328C2F9|nr:hypothetical protein [Steroidobacter agaridevorans]GFE91745.1 hypothetical protein GCM10011488_66990 [Steroidobacter agaridevorans]